MTPIAPRHSPDWYDQTSWPLPIDVGERLFIRCEGGPCRSRLEDFPPLLEIAETDGLYVLEDDGPPHDWCYVFIPSA